MNSLKIFSDTLLSDSAVRLLQAQTAPHEVVFSPTLATSALIREATDASFAQVDIAFGQPDVPSILKSDKLRWVHLTSAGFTRYDTPEFRAAAKARGLIVTNSTSVYAEPCAEHVFAFMMAQARQLPLALRSQFENGSVPWGQLRHATRLLRGQKVVILGYGGIAMRLVEMLRPFGVSIVAFRRTPRGDESVPIITLAELPAALAQADHVVNVLPSNAASDGFVSAARLAAMKRGAVFYNIGRGATVDQEALLMALRSGQLAAAWLDVTEPEPLSADHPLRAEPNCFITPHIAGGHENESESLVRHFGENFRRYVAGEVLLDRIM